MSDAKLETKRPRKSSRREFLKQAVKKSSVAAPIACGVLDSEIKKLLIAQERRKYLSKEALEAPLPTNGLETIILLTMTNSKN